MNAWLPAQILFAAIAWYFAARSVIQIGVFAGMARVLPATIRQLRLDGKAAEVPRLAEPLGSEALGDLLELDADRLSAEEIVASAQRSAAQVVPPVRVLRALATVGTMLGLLAAVATLRSGLDAATARAMEFAANRAFDSAVAGFVTALPCWTAVAVCRRLERRALSGLDRVVLALRAEPPATAPETT